MNRIVNAFFALGLSVDQELFHALASSGKVLLLLDAFDEIPDELKSKVLTDIEDLAARHENLRIIVTSRPNHNIQTSNHFAVVKLDDLKGTEYEHVICKLASGQTWAQGLIEHISQRAVHIKELLCTPLIVTLLVLSYKSYQKLPTKLSDFYDELFQTLLQRHDGTKPGFNRQRGCDLDDSEYRQAFEALCILTKKNRQESLTPQVIYNLAKESLAQCNLNANPKSYIDDIVKITCLVIRDGEEHRFIHKTVQEYYAATYIQRKPDAWSRDFYTRVLNANAFQEWQQELEFLAEVDNYRYNRYFYLPSVLKFLKLTETNVHDQKQSFSREFVASVVDPLLISWKGNKPIDNNLRLTWFARFDFITKNIIEKVISFHTVDLQKEAVQIASKYPELIMLSKVNNVTHPFPPDSDQGVSLGNIIMKGGAEQILLKTQHYCNELFENARALSLSLQKEENPSLLDGLV